MNGRSRREFLQDVGQGMLVASLGSAAAVELGIAPCLSKEAEGRLTFGELEPLVSLLQETPPENLLPKLVGKLNDGTDLKTLVSAGALANAREFGGQDYTGYHTFMALMPAYQMAAELPVERRALPVLKVLYRNSSRIHDQNAHDHDTLHPVEADSPAEREHGGERLRETVRAVDWEGAETQFASIAARSPEEAFNDLQLAVQDEANVHRVVLAWRAWATLDLAGEQHAHTMLRQSLRYCLDTEQEMRDRNRQRASIRELLPSLLDEHGLLGKTPGQRKADDAWTDELAHVIVRSSNEQAAAAVAAALAEGFSPEDIGEAISMAANLLVLHDPGRREQYSSAQKPAGCVHGDSIGVHASDAANAWRNIARVSNRRNQIASLIVGAYHTAGQSAWITEEQYPYTQFLDDLDTEEDEKLLALANEAIQSQDQARACAIAHRYTELQLPTPPLFALLLNYAVSEDGALHAEKYYRTVVEEYATTREAFRSRQLIALARVTASECGYPAPGMAEACELLKLS